MPKFVIERQYLVPLGRLWGSGGAAALAGNAFPEITES
jgi:hypothetical protein